MQRCCKCSAAACGSCIFKAPHGSSSLDLRSPFPPGRCLRGAQRRPPCSLRRKAPCTPQRWSPLRPPSPTTTEAARGPLRRAFSALSAATLSLVHLFLYLPPPSRSAVPGAASLVEAGTSTGIALLMLSGSVLLFGAPFVAAHEFLNFQVRAKSALLAEKISVDGGGVGPRGGARASKVTPVRECTEQINTKRRKRRKRAQH